MFGFSNKPGRGVSKEEAAKRNYFDIYGRHFGHITGANFWYLLSNILFFGAALILFYAYFNGDNIVYMVTSVMRGEFFLIPFVPFIPFMFIGPFTAGYTYVIRNYAKQSPTFLISDFFEHSKKNFKQAIIVSIFSAIISYLLLQAFVFYNFIFKSNGMPMAVLYILWIFVAVLYVIMLFYVYPIMVTFKMNLKTVLKNAWVFTVSKLPQNIIIFLIVAGVNAIVLYVFQFVLYLPDIFYLFVLGLFLTGFSSFTANYYIWHVMDKYIVSLVTPKREKESVFDDDTYPDFDDGYDEEAIIEDEYLL